jgi:branched-chain amino acid aminotransferase
MYVCLNGKFVDHKKALIPTSDHGFLYGDAVYETLRTRNGELWLFEQHMKRLKKSAKAVGIKVPSLDFEELIEELIKKNKLKEARVRITLSRGSNNFEFNSCKKPLLLIEAKPLKLPPKEVIEKGVSVISYQIERTKPKIKSTSMLPAVLAQREAKKKNAYEALLVNNEGYVTECSYSNIFIVKNNKLKTPKKDILEGTVRNYIIAHYKTKRKKLTLRNVKKADEVFITSTIKGVVPVVKIDGKKIGNGHVGPITQKLMKIL